jgi:hypothetical protein
MFTLLSAILSGLSCLWLPKTLFAAESLMISGGVVRLKSDGKSA